MRGTALAGVVKRDWERPSVAGAVLPRACVLAVPPRLEAAVEPRLVAAVDTRLVGVEVRRAVDPLIVDAGHTRE